MKVFKNENGDIVMDEEMAMTRLDLWNMTEKELEQIPVSFTVRVNPTITDNRLAAKYPMRDISEKADGVAFSFVFSPWVIRKLKGEGQSYYAYHEFEDNLRTQAPKMTELLINNIMKTFKAMTGWEDR